MKTFIKKWGNSAAIRLPLSIMQSANLELGQELRIREENGTIIIEPARDTHSELEQLVAAITPDNLPDDMDFGPAVGEEFDL